MGKLLKEICDTPAVRGGSPKKIDIILEQLDEQDRQDLLDAINDHTIQATTITRVLKKRGFDIGRKCINRYRGFYNES